LGPQSVSGTTVWDFADSIVGSRERFGAAGRRRDMFNGDVGERKRGLLCLCAGRRFRVPTPVLFAAGVRGGSPYLLTVGWGNW